MAASLESRGSVFGRNTGLKEDPVRTFLYKFLVRRGKLSTCLE